MKLIKHDVHKLYFSAVVDLFVNCQLLEIFFNLNKIAKKDSEILNKIRILDLNTMSLIFYTATRGASPCRRRSMVVQTTCKVATALRS